MQAIKLSYQEGFNKTAIELDGSKSISNRLLVLQQISNIPFTIENLSCSDDTVLMQQFFNDFQTLKGRNDGVFNVHNAGTVSRFITAFLANEEGTTITLNCAEPMKKRPINILVDALKQLGAHITYLEQDGFLPIQIIGKQLKGDSVTLSASVSSQFISALMMIAPSLPNGLSIHLEGEIASKPYLEITQNLMLQLGFSVEFIENTIHIQNQQQNDTFNIIFNESDWSAAAFYYTICSFVPNSEIQLSTLFLIEESSQGDAQVASIFKELGVETKFENNKIQLKQTNQHKNYIEIDFIDKPDMVPAIAVACAGLGVEAKFTGVKNLVIKESNRLQALQNELQKVGVEFNAITNNEWHLKGKAHFEDNTISFDTYEDHRMAMCLACFTFLKQELIINEPKVVSKSYANFWSDISKLSTKSFIIEA